MMSSTDHKLTRTQPSLSEGKIHLQTTIRNLISSSQQPFSCSQSIFYSTASRADESWMLFFVALWDLIGNFTWTIQFPGCFLRLLLLSPAKNLVIFLFALVIISCLWDGIKQGSKVRFLILKLHDREEAETLQLCGLLTVVH